MKSLIGTAAILLLSIRSVLLAAGPVDGEWAGQVDSDANAPLVLFTLQTNDSTLTGTIAGGGGKLSIDSGTATDTSLQFQATQHGSNGSTLTFTCSGTVDGDSIAMTCDAGSQGTKSFTIKRQKAT
jgi:hypothetical protein